MSENTEILIQATSRGVKGTLADGTVRFLIEVEPAYANDAFALFGMPGSPLVIARLTQEAVTAAQQAETVAGDTDVPENTEKPKGGDLARLAGMLCTNQKFQEWADVSNSDAAAEFIRRRCGIQSRAELDNDWSAAEVFHKRVRLPFVAWQEGR